ncbi:hypothetical protein MNAN1_003410 [Malassezia nana]|uniref:COP9 signalosome complex subunit 3 n=1 Tax=Malassezia nana TaxID=180528 RepID=A0AAF0EPR2_9BASI|nr:hypothetical protein MNAN1_003410 [Malassezia nana]
MRMGSTEAFVAAVQEAGADPVRVSEVLSHYVPEPPTAEADELLLGPKGTGRTAELFASHASPLGALACISAELRRASDLGDVAPLALPIQEVLASHDLRSHLVCMPRLVAQFASTLGHKKIVYETLDTTRYLEALWQCLAQGYRGVTSVHAPLLQVDRAQQLWEATDLDATEATGCLAQPHDVVAYVSEVGAMYASTGSYAAAEDLWDTALALPCGTVTLEQARVFPQAVCVKLLLHARVPPLQEMMPLASTSMRAYLAREWESWIAYARAYEHAISWNGMLAGLVPTPPAAYEDEAPLLRTLHVACTAHLPRHRLVRLASLFSTLPLTYVAHYVGRREDETCELVQALCNEGVLQADIQAWDPTSLTQSVPLPGSGPVGPLSPRLVCFPATHASTDRALHSTLCRVGAAEQAATQRLEEEHHAQLLSHHVLSNVLALHLLVSLAPGEADDSAADVDLDAPAATPVP